MLRWLAALVLAATPLALTDNAHACSCNDRPLAEHAKTEKRVMLARAGKPIKTGDALKQTFTVLATFKGPAEATFTLDRRATPPCASNYKEGDVALLFTSDTQLDPCHGNLDLASALDHFPAVIAATGTKRTAEAPLPAIEVGLRDALAMYVHNRAEIPVKYTAHGGKSVTVDKSRLTFSSSDKPNQIVLDTTFVAADTAYLAGTYKPEGLRFAVILVQDNKAWKAVGKRVVER